MARLLLAALTPEQVHLALTAADEPTTAAKDRKRLLRTLIADVTVRHVDDTPAEVHDARPNCTSWPGVCTALAGDRRPGQPADVGRRSSCPRRWAAPCTDGGPAA
ncbi:hypothetical protein [Streptomyces mirabilis]|uniref:hypothetical protein n=1 Tax=Streptomyces mirabilis TaxID=68239 RepID=UPI0033338798